MAQLGNLGIRSRVVAQDWRAAVRAAGELMVEAGGCTPEYVSAMEDGVVTFGPYIVVAPGVAIPHARPERGALIQGTAVLTLAEPVAFGEPTNDPVDLLIAFTAYDKNSHLATLQIIVAMLSDTPALARLRAAPNDLSLTAALRDAEKELTR